MTFLLTVALAADPGVAVVELFTSEGCSACPAADAFVSRLDAEARQQAKSVYVLAWHVDYWDGLGWSDPWANPGFSERQEAYGDQLGAKLYTPQMVVNGQSQLLGSDEDAARTQIKRALAEPAEASVELGQIAFDGKRLSVELSSELHDGSVVQAALVERNLRSEVHRGENEGLTLKHDGVVRAFASFAPGETIRLLAPMGLDPVHTSLIVFGQEPETLRVLGATSAELP